MIATFLGRQGAALATLLILAPLSFGQARDLRVILDGLPVASVRARIDGSAIWIRTEWVAEKLGLKVERPAAGAPCVVCRDASCRVVPAEAMTDDGREVRVDILLKAFGARLRHVTATGHPVRLEIEFPKAPPSTPALRRIEVGEAMPDVEFERIGGGTISPAEFRGRKLVIVNWASW